MESLEKSASYVSDKFENWRIEKAVLLSQITEMKTEYESKFDDIEQYSRRSCLERIQIIWFLMLSVLI